MASEFEGCSNVTGLSFCALLFDLHVGIVTPNSAHHSALTAARATDDGRENEKTVGQHLSMSLTRYRVANCNPVVQKPPRPNRDIVSRRSRRWRAFST